MPELTLTMLDERFGEEATETAVEIAKRCHGAEPPFLTRDWDGWWQRVLADAKARLESGA